MLDTIYICRHGFRMNWVGGETFWPTGRPRDPVLTAHGQNQAQALAEYMAALPEGERPELIVSSPYYRCLQTAAPTAKRLGIPMVCEPGVAEWFPPAPKHTGLHPAPASAATMQHHVPSLGAPAIAWSPLLYPDSAGESQQALHARAHAILRLIQHRCTHLGYRRILICSHAATLIALGRALTQNPTKHIGAGTATLSLYKRTASVHDLDSAPWTQVLNAHADFLPNGTERDWSFSHVPDNVTEPGMGIDWIDEERPAQPSDTSAPPSKL